MNIKATCSRCYGDGHYDERYRTPRQSDIDEPLNTVTCPLCSGSGSVLLDWSAGTLDEPMWINGRVRYESYSGEDADAHVRWLLKDHRISAQAGLDLLLEINKQEVA